MSDGLTPLVAAVVGLSGDDAENGRRSRERVVATVGRLGAGYALARPLTMRLARNCLRAPLRTGRRHVEAGERRTRKDWAGWTWGMPDLHYRDATRGVPVKDNLTTSGFESLHATLSRRKASGWRDGPRCTQARSAAGGPISPRLN